MTACTALLGVVATAVVALGPTHASSPAHLIKDIDPTKGSRPNGMTALGNLVVFDLGGGSGPGPVWVSDGTEAGTFELTITQANLKQYPFRAGRLIYFNGNDQDGVMGLWRTDGTVAGTVLVTREWWSTTAAPVGDRLLLTGFDPDHGGEPWVTDGSASGTHQIVDLETGPAGSFPVVLDSDGSHAYFGTPSNAANARSLWISDGTEAGTRKVRDVNMRNNFPGNEHAVLSGRLFFVGNDAAHGDELWISDGSETGTNLVKEITEGPAGSFLQHFTKMSGTLFFFHHLPGPPPGPHPAELWKSDGTEAGTVLVRQFETFLVDQAVAVGGQLFFSATPPAGGSFQLWRSDGTTDGTRVIREHDLQIGRGGLSVGRLAEVGGMVLFDGASDSGGFEPWRSDGTDAGTFRVQDIAPEDASSDPYGFVSVGRRVYFTADDGVHGAELWGGRAAIVTHQPRRAVEDLSDEVRDLTLPSGLATSLQAKLDASLRALDRGGRGIGASFLRSFSSEVVAQRGKHIPSAEADELLEFVSEIIDLIGGDGD